MKHVGLVVYIDSKSFWYCNGLGSYLLGKYSSRNEMCDIKEWQDKRIYLDEYNQGVNDGRYARVSK